MYFGRNKKNPNRDHGALYYSSYQNESMRDLNMLRDLLVITSSGRVPVVNYTCFLSSSLLWYFLYSLAGTSSVCLFRELENS